MRGKGSTSSESLAVRRSNLVRRDLPLGLAAITGIGLAEGPNIVGGVGHLGSAAGSVVAGAIGPALGSLGPVAHGPVGLGLISGLAASAVVASGFDQVSREHNSRESFNGAAKASLVAGAGAGAITALATGNPAALLLAAPGALVAMITCAAIEDFREGHQLTPSTRRVINTTATRYGGAIALGAAAALGLETLTGTHGVVPAITETVMASAVGLTAFPALRGLRSRGQQSTASALERG